MNDEQKRCPRCGWPTIEAKAEDEVFCANANCGYVGGPTANELRST
jgi:ribosomal protein S27AE